MAVESEVVGRELELAAIDAYLDAPPGGPAALLVEGEAPHRLEDVRRRLARGWATDSTARQIPPIIRERPLQRISWVVDMR